MIHHVQTLSPEELAKSIQDDGTLPDDVDAPFNYWHETWFLETYLRPDHHFTQMVATTRFPYDPERIDSIICQVQAGCALKAVPEDVHCLFTRGTCGSRTFDDHVVLDVLSELYLDDLISVFRHSGATPREIASVYRSIPERITYMVFIALNKWSDLGPKDLPRMYEKEMFTEYDGRSSYW